MVKCQYVLYSFPVIGFYEFGVIPRADYDQYRMYYVCKYSIKGRAFYLHGN